MLAHIREFVDGETIKVLAVAGFAGTIAQVNTVEFITQLGQMAIVWCGVVYLVVKTYRYVCRPTKKQLKGEE